MKSALCMILAALLAGVGPARSDKLRVVTTTADLAAIARRVGGERVEVETIARGYQDPHYVQARPSYMRRVNRADLLVYTGLQLEIGWLPVLIEGARNPAVVPGASGLLDASRGIEVLEVPAGEVDRTMGDIHPEGNPHYLLDPRNGVLVARLIADRLGQLDPDHAADYAAALAEFEADMARQIEGWELRLRATEDTSLIAFHRTWTYLAAWAGIQIANYIEVKPGIPPGPRHLASLVDQMAAEGIGAIALAHYNPTRSGKSLAERSGARLLILPAAVEAFDDVAEYADLFDRIVSDLETAGGGTP